MSTSTAQYIIHCLKDEILASGVHCTEDTSFESLGLDSYSIIQLVLTLETKTGKSLLENGLKQIHLQNAATLSAFIDTIPDNL